MPSGRFLTAITAQESSEAVVVLVTITHADFAAPMRFCTGGEDIVSNGNTFEARAMKVSLPGEGDSGQRRARLNIDAVEPDVIAELRNVGAGRPQVSMELILSAFPDDVEISYLGLSITAARPQGESIEIEIMPRDDGEEEWPVQSYSQGRVPGLF